MKFSETIPLSLPEDIALKIASLLQVTDLCALGSCSRFWRQLCGYDFLWESMCKKRWPLMFLGSNGQSSSVDRDKSTTYNGNDNGWRGIYIKWHNNMVDAANSVVRYVEQSMSSDSLEIKDYLKAVEDLSASQVGFRDVEMFLFNSNVNVLLNLVGLHYSISWLGVPTEQVMEALENCKISQRQVCVKWWKLGRWFYGFRMRDEYHSRWVSLQDLAAAEDNEVLGVLNRGAIYEVFRIQISVSNPTHSSWSHQSTQV